MAEQKDIICTKCNKKYKTSKTLEIHIKQMHPVDTANEESKEPVYNCLYCNQLFIRGFHIIQHYKETHQEILKISNMSRTKILNVAQVSAAVEQESPSYC